jgi:hypothetical protein
MNRRSLILYLYKIPPNLYRTAARSSLSYFSRQSHLSRIFITQVSTVDVQ